MASFTDALTAAQNRWQAAALLLASWNSRPAHVHPRRDDDRFLEVVDEVRAHFDASPDQLELTDADRSLLLKSTAAGADPHGVDAAGFGLNLAASKVFAQAWREQLAGETFRPADGDIYPVADAPWPKEARAGRRTPGPRSMHIDDDDHPYARVFRGGAISVDFDLRLWRPLRALANRLDVVAAATVNETLAELGLDEHKAIAFPVTPRDRDEQRTRVLGRLEAAIHGDADIIVFPELSTSPELAEAVRSRLGEDDRQRLVVCGSWHEEDETSGEPANVSVGLVSGVETTMYHRKIAEFGDLYPRDPGRRTREGIASPQSPSVRIYVADAFRFAIVICKDFLDAGITEVLDRVGANVLLVPSLSRTTHPFAARAAAHVADAQAISVVANGPRTWDGDIPAPTASVARPYEPHDRLDVVAPSTPSVALFSIQDGDARFE